jgi:YHS domain-containing protein
MTMKHQGSERTFKDPVCGMEVSRLTAVEEMDYQGKTYYFCSGYCRQAFETEPENYLRRHRQHGVKPT